MRSLCLALLLLLVGSAVAEAQVRVQGYYRSSGTYVQPHYRSAPNYSRWDNWSTVGNVNPYTGSYGTRWPSYTPYRAYTPYVPSYSYRPYTPLYGGYGGYRSSTWDW